jgi:hypothetical protein
MVKRFLVKDLLERISGAVMRKGYSVEAYSNHLLIYGSEFKADITVIDDYIIIIQTRGFPKDSVGIMKVEDLIKKADEELLSLLGIRDEREVCSN